MRSKVKTYNESFLESQAQDPNHSMLQRMVRYEYCEWRYGQAVLWKLGTRMGRLYGTILGRRSYRMTNPGRR